MRWISAAYGAPMRCGRLGNYLRLARRQFEFLAIVPRLLLAAVLYVRRGQRLIPGP
jgi:hypothetical protein